MDSKDMYKILFQINAGVFLSYTYIYMCVCVCVSSYSKQRVLNTGW